MSEAATAAPLKKTALNATHRALKAKMVDFGGWDMPVEYPWPGRRLDRRAHGGAHRRGPVRREPHGRDSVSRARLAGRRAAHHHERRVALKDGQAHYSALLTPQGTFVDDILVHRLSENDYLLVVNAGTKDKDLRLDSPAGGRAGRAIHISDYSSYYSQLALQGPRALETLQKLTKVDLAAIKNYWFTWGTVAGDSQRADRAHRLLAAKTASRSTSLPTRRPP